MDVQRGIGRFITMKKAVPTNPRVIFVEIVVGQDVPRKIGYMPTSIYGVRLRTLNNE